jgi:hypothetical protein
LGFGVNPSVGYQHNCTRKEGEDKKTVVTIFLAPHPPLFLSLYLPLFSLSLNHTAGKGKKVLMTVNQLQEKR